MQKIERAKGEAISKGSKPKKLVNAGAISKSFDVSDYAETTTKTQEICDICKPSAEKRRGAAQVCGECREKSEKQVMAFIQPGRPRKIVKLHRCAGCGNCLAAAKFSFYHAVCRKCLQDAKEKSKTGRSNFIERTLNNLRKSLKGELINA